MKKLLLLLILAVASCTTPQHSPDTTVTIGTFNIEWLGDGEDDRRPRTDQDYLRIADIILKSKADVMAVQEIENLRALQLILRYLPDHNGFIADEAGPQNVGVIYHKSVQVSRIDTYRPLQLDAASDLRPGLVIRCVKGAFTWAQMIVHLKSTSRYDSTAALLDQSREWRSRQAAVLRSWIDSVSASPNPNALITGDLNDYPQRSRNATLTALTNDGGPTFVTKSLMSCKDAKWHCIDHVVASSTAMRRYIDGTARTENLYDFLTKEEVERISDHCPVVARFSTLQ
jgi:endonuclease/exonuclease/phosphatase family metal-dependent hydrolase